MTDTQPNTSFVTAGWEASGIHRFSHQAMATTFEIFISHHDQHYARQAAQAAFDELDRLEAELSRFIENSDISRINELVANQPLQVGPAAFECLRLCARMYAETNGAFDVTIGTLMECWLDENKLPRTPSAEELARAKQRTGMHLLELDATQHTIRLLASPVRIDLGGIGKGYAVDKMAELLCDWSIDNALIHGGYSTVLALGRPPDNVSTSQKDHKIKAATKGWPLTLTNPAESKQTLARICLQDRAVGASGLQKGRHIIDPRTLRPVQGRLAAWACAPTAAAADALSTAFMVMSPTQVEQYCLSHPDILAMIVTRKENTGAREQTVLRYGRWEKFLV